MTSAYRAAAFAAAAVFGAAFLAVPNARAEGGDLYRQHCSVCHQAGGAGLAGVYPRLAGRAPKIAAAPAGRRMMAAAVLNGMAGRLEVDGKPLMGVMPGFPQLSDQDLAEVLSYVASLGGKPAKPFAPAEVAAVRAAGRMSPTQTNALARAVNVE
ncbi:cytochrome c [Phenylobacterium sp.]|uniref:c-type cytochrome n=1 Tax=Phenylobacterium sp. TaxID=1871053 RepID=UPI0035B0E7F3